MTWHDRLQNIFASIFPSNKIWREKLGSFHFRAVQWMTFWDRLNVTKLIKNIKILMTMRRNIKDLPFLDVCILYQLNSLESTWYCIYLPTPASLWISMLCYQKDPNDQLSPVWYIASTEHAATDITFMRAWGEEILEKNQYPP